MLITKTGVQAFGVAMMDRYTNRPARFLLALPPPSPRKLSHTRTVVYTGYDREDGLWDIEAALSDVKTYDFQVSSEPRFPAQQPIHALKIRVTLNDKMVIQDIATSMDSIPHNECASAPHGMHQLIGCTMGPGWRKVINEHVGGTQGCTHLREMLFNMATAAYQTLPSGQWHRREVNGMPQPVVMQAPFHLGQCHSWAYDSPTVQRAYPMFYRPKSSDNSNA
jgi:hypothetical protein